MSRPQTGSQQIMRPLDKKFWRPLSQSKVVTRLRLNVCWWTSEACKYKKRNRDGDHDDLLLNWNIGCTKHTVDLYCTESIQIATSAFQESFTSKQWLSSKVEAWNYTKNKLLKLVDLIKIKFIFAGLNLNVIIQ